MLALLLRCAARCAASLRGQRACLPCLCLGVAAAVGRCGSRLRRRCAGRLPFRIPQGGIPWAPAYDRDGMRQPGHAQASAWNFPPPEQTARLGRQLTDGLLRIGLI